MAQVWENCRWRGYRGYRCGCDRRCAAERVKTRPRGEILGCRPAGKDGHMAVDRHGVPWAEIHAREAQHGSP